MALFTNLRLLTPGPELPAFPLTSTLQTLLFSFGVCLTSLLSCPTCGCAQGLGSADQPPAGSLCLSNLACPQTWNIKSNTHILFPGRLSSASAQFLCVNDIISPS